MHNELICSEANTIAEDLIDFLIVCMVCLQERQISTWITPILTERRPVTAKLFNILTVVS